MKKDYCALSFSEKERICEATFLSNGPYWHVYTDGTKMQNIFNSEEDFNIGMWQLAISAAMVPKAVIITFELMKNHAHLIMSGRKEDCLELFGLFTLRLKNVFKRNGQITDWSRFQVDVLPIESLKSLRNEIIYVNRNAYVAHPNCTPDSYLWGGGCAYFSSWLKYLQPTPLGESSIERQRTLLRTRETKPFSNLKSIHDMVYIPSFCNISLGESMFQDPRSYFSALTRNSEAYSQIAERLKDTVFLTDDELYAVASSYASQEYSTRQLPTLTPQQKLSLARHLHFKYNATNQQLRRLLRLDPAVLNEMFPH